MRALGLVALVVFGAAADDAALRFAQTEVQPSWGFSLSFFQTLLTICCAQANGMYQSDSRPERGLQGGARELASEMEIESFAAEGHKRLPPG